MLHEVAIRLVRGEVDQLGHAPDDRLATPAHPERDLAVGEHPPVSSRIEDIGVAARLARDRVEGCSMVVSAEDDIRLRDRPCQVIADIGSHRSRTPLLLSRTTVHETDQEIRLLTQDLRQVGPGGLHLVSKL